MNVEYINPFVEGAQNVLNDVCGESPSLGSLSVKEIDNMAAEVSISIDIIGQIAGKVIFTMKKDVAFFIVSKMMFGMPIETLDEMAQSAVSELGNIISGNVATLFSSKGILIDIKPPYFKLNPKISDFSSISGKGVCIPLVFQDSKTFEVNIFIEN